MNCLLSYISLSTWDTIKTNIYLYGLNLRSTQRCINVHVRLNVRHIFAILIHAVIDHCNKNSWYM